MPVDAQRVKKMSDEIEPEADVFDLLDDIEEKHPELWRKVLGVEPTQDYEKGFKDGLEAVRRELREMLEHEGENG